jgi:adenine phosphoribosyltransferase
MAAAAAAAAASAPGALPLERESLRKELYEVVEHHENFPIEGVTFHDFFPLCRLPKLLSSMVASMATFVRSGALPDAIVGLDSRGFIFGPMLAVELDIPFLPVRKPGKLPGKCIREAYKLEYGEVGVRLRLERSRGWRV